MHDSASNITACPGDPKLRPGVQRTLTRAPIRRSRSAGPSARHARDGAPPRRRRECGPGRWVPSATRPQVALRVHRLEDQVDGGRGVRHVERVGGRPDPNAMRRPALDRKRGVLALLVAPDPRQILRGELVGRRGIDLPRPAPPGAGRRIDLVSSALPAPRRAPRRGWFRLPRNGSSRGRSSRPRGRTSVAPSDAEA